jgi:hypothetical protein
VLPGLASPGRGSSNRSRSRAGALANSQPPTRGFGPLSVMELMWASRLGIRSKSSHSPDKLRAASAGEVNMTKLPPGDGMTNINPIKAAMCALRRC